MTTNIEIKLENLIKNSMEQKLEEIVPNFRKKHKLTEEQITKIINTIGVALSIKPERVYIGMILLFLQGAASAGTPNTMLVELEEGKCIEKKNIIVACESVTGNRYIRRIAEALAVQIGEFALKNKLAGELAFRINNRYKATTGNNLTEKEMAFCSSFSQSIPNLAELTSENLVRLLAEDYQKRFENKKKSTNKSEEQMSSKKKPTKPKRKK